VFTSTIVGILNQEVIKRVFFAACLV